MRSRSWRLVIAWLSALSCRRGSSGTFPRPPPGADKRRFCTARSSLDGPVGGPGEGSPETPAVPCLRDRPRVSPEVALRGRAQLIVTCARWLRLWPRPRPVTRSSHSPEQRCEESPARPGRGPRGPRRPAVSPLAIRGRRRGPREAPRRGRPGAGPQTSALLPSGCPGAALLWKPRGLRPASPVQKRLRGRAPHPLGLPFLVSQEVRSFLALKFYSSVSFM